MEIITKRLKLRDPRIGDAPDVVESLNDLGILSWLFYEPYPYTINDAVERITNIQNNSKKDPRKSYYFFIQLIDNEKVFGEVELHRVDREQGSAALGFWIGKSYHNQGYASEALKPLLDFAFNSLNLRRLEGIVFRGNEPSRKLLEKLGFQCEGIRREARISKADGKVKDEYIYGLLKKEYTKDLS